MRRPIIAGNWKMNKTIAEASELVNNLKEALKEAKNREIVICPPFPALSAIKDLLKGSNIKLGAQNMYFEAKGAFTGEVSGVMLRDVGCEYVIIGHSERRQYFKETDEMVSKKLKVAISNGLIPIVCIGETLNEMEAGDTFKVLEKQVKDGLGGLSPDEVSKLVVAYEPIWAIGTGKTATPQQAEEVHKFIRKLLSTIYGEDKALAIRILYGGSIKPANIKELMECENIDGGLVGGASLEADSFIKIVKY
ncbi:triose-phosphate isomerase [bacterium]|nr:triose-phosphate isomerase [bacterium]